MFTGEKAVKYRRRTQFTHQQMRYLLTRLKVLIHTKIYNNIAPTFGL